MTTVLVVDDQSLIRSAVRDILSHEQGIEVVGEAANGRDAVTLAGSLRPDVVLMDIRMPGIDGVEATRRIRALYAADQLRLIILTTFDHDKNVFEALRAGANGFLSKGMGPAELTAGIEEVAAGGGALSAVASAALIDHVAQEKSTEPDAAMADRFTALTPRERDVVIAIATGRDNAQIAAEMFVSPYTVKTHANRAMAKVGARDRAQLVVFTFQAGIAHG